MKTRNMRRRQWDRYLRHYLALSRRVAPYYVTDAAGTFQAWPLLFSPGYNRMTARETFRRMTAHQHRRNREGGGIW